jgi:Uma2 family endonuclease
MTAATAGQGRKLTLEDWAALPEDEEGELVDGVLVEEEMPSFVHEVAVAWLISFFRAWASPRRGFVTGSGLKLRVASRRGRMADVVVYFRRGKVQARGLVTVPPDVAVEIVSPDPKDQKRDRIDKLKEYAAFGIRYYWLVSPELRSIEILELGADGRYIHALDLSEGKSAVPGCEDLEIDVDDLWRDVQAAEQEEGD